MFIHIVYQSRPRHSFPILVQARLSLFRAIPPRLDCILLTVLLYSRTAVLPNYCSPVLWHYCTTLYSPLATHYSLFSLHHSLVAARYALATAQHPPPTTHGPLLATPHSPVTSLPDGDTLNDSDCCAPCRLLLLLLVVCYQ